jgi:hypothetical protein
MPVIAITAADCHPKHDAAGCLFHINPDLTARATQPLYWLSFMNLEK